MSCRASIGESANAGWGSLGYGARHLQEIDRSSDLWDQSRGAAQESLMSSRILILISTLTLAVVPAAAAAQKLDGLQEGIKQDSVSQGRSQTGGQSYGNRNRGGPYGLYSYPRHRHVDGGRGGALDRPAFSALSYGTSPYCGNCHGSAYYGRDYGAPYFGGGYYDRGVYYRERRDR